MYGAWWQKSRWNVEGGEKNLYKNSWNVLRIDMYTIIFKHQTQPLYNITRKSKVENEKKVVVVVLQWYGRSCVNVVSKLIFFDRKKKIPEKLYKIMFYIQEKSSSSYKNMYIKIHTNRQCMYIHYTLALPSLSTSHLYTKNSQHIPKYNTNTYSL